MNSIEDDIALQNLMATYVDAANRRDGEAWKNTWAADGVWSIMGTDISGRDNIHALWTQVLEGFEFALLMPASGQFEVTGDTATGHWYLQEFTRSTEGETSTMMSHYQDSYCRTDNKWLYQSRASSVLYSGPADLSGHYNPLPQQE